MDKKWLMVSWRRNDFLDGRYGELVKEFTGTYEEAANEARQYVPQFSPIGVVGVIE